MGDTAYRIPGVRAWRRSLLVALAAVLLAACGGASAATNGGGTPTLNWYIFHEPSTASPPPRRVARPPPAASTPSRSGAAGGRRRPARAAGPAQRGQGQLLDILGLDVVWEAEFAEAGWIQPWTGARRQQVERDAVKAALDTATWKGQLVAAPFNSNTQLLWYRKDLVPHPPKTWAEMLSQAEALARQGKPHFIEIQGASYEGYTVWINAMIASAGGRGLSENGQQVVLGPAAAKGVSVVGQLVRSPAADPSLGVQMEDQNRLAFETGKAAFEVNYPFVYPSAQQNAPAIARQMGWAEYPRVDAMLPSRPPVGGIDLAVSAFSRHKQQAFDAITCLRNSQNQLRNAVKGGLPPTLASLYKDPGSSTAATRSRPRSSTPCSAAASVPRPRPTSRSPSPCPRPCTRRRQPARASSPSSAASCRTPSTPRG